MHGHNDIIHVHSDIIDGHSDIIDGQNDIIDGQNDIVDYQNDIIDDQNDIIDDQNDIIDDRIDVVTRGLLGLTVACARCHDHKSEPVTMRDYYALHGIFASSEEPAEKPLLAPVTDTAEHRAYLEKRAATEERVRAREREEVAKFLVGIRGRTGDYLLGVHDAARLPP
jgi:hypothetical protein